MKNLDRNRAIRAAIVLLTVMLVLVVCTAFAFSNPEKHTGTVVVDDYTERGYQFSRANGEIFVMRFYDGAPRLYPGDKFSDIVYVDSKGNSQYFVKGNRTSKGPRDEADGKHVCPPGAICMVYSNKFSD